jgi:hypothetical protein
MENLREISTTQMNLGDLYGGPGGPNLHDPATALRYYQEATKTREKLAEVDRENASAVEDLANVYAKLANLSAQDAPVRSLALFRQALALLDSLPPGKAEGVRSSKARWRTRMSAAMLASGDRAGALKEAADALAARLVLAGKKPDPDESGDLSESYLAIGNAELSDGQSAEAHRHFSAAAKLMEQFRGLASTNLEVAFNLSAAWEALEHFADERAPRRALRLALWREWNRALPSAYSRAEEQRAPL